eukprot:COSAG05_NODE_224_length_13609_cov_26.220429_6_plen_166_part_00
MSCVQRALYRQCGWRRAARMRGKGSIATTHLVRNVGERLGVWCIRHLPLDPILHGGCDCFCGIDPKDRGVWALCSPAPVQVIVKAGGLLAVRGEARPDIVVVVVGSGAVEAAEQVEPTTRGGAAPRRHPSIPLRATSSRVRQRCGLPRNTQRHSVTAARKYLSES